MNTDAYSGKRGRQLLGFFLPVGWVVIMLTPGKVHHSSEFSQNWRIALTADCQSPRNGFVILSRLIHGNYFVLLCIFLNFFLRSLSVHFVRQVQFQWCLDLTGSTGDNNNAWVWKWTQLSVITVHSRFSKWVQFIYHISLHSARHVWDFILILHFVSTWVIP